MDYSQGTNVQRAHNEIGAWYGIPYVSMKDTLYGQMKAGRYTQEELTKKKHNYELVPSGHTILCVDYKQDGIGSNSCGPGPEKQYQFSENEFVFEFGLRPNYRN